MAPWAFASPRHNRDYCTTPYPQQQRPGDTAVFWGIARMANSPARQAALGKPAENNAQASRKDVEKFRGLHSRFLTLTQRAEKLNEDLPQDRKNFYQGHLLTQLGIYRHGFAIMLRIAQAITAFNQNNTAAAIERLDQALAEYDTLLALLRKAEYTPWQGWYAGDKFDYIYQTQHDIKRCRATLAHETPPPPTLPRQRYPTLYQYQQKFKNNYPLMYPAP